MFDSTDVKGKLKSGDEIIFSNENTGVQITCSHGPTVGGYDCFKIWDGVAYVHISRTFGSFERKLIELIECDGLEIEI